MAITKVTSGTITDSTITNDDINASAAIAQSKVANVPYFTNSATAPSTPSAGDMWYYTTSAGGGGSYWGRFGHSGTYNGSAYTATGTPTIYGNGGYGFHGSGASAGSAGFVYVQEFK